MTAGDAYTGADLEAALASHVGHIRGVSHVPSPGRSSAPIDDVDVLLDDGTTLELVAKAMDWDALLPEGRAAKPGFLWNADRERATYEAILSRTDLGTPRCYGSCVARSGSRYLLLERVRGVPLWQRGDVEAWCAAARWLARCHSRLDAGAAARSAAAPQLLRYDRRFFACWPARALAFHGHGAALQRVTAAHARLVPWLQAEPAAFIHGEFYPANVLIEDAAAPPHVRPVDWEMAAIGPPLMDVACLLAGRWQDDQREVVADAYFAECARETGKAGDRTERLRALDMCLLHLSVRNLGWSRDWAPPADRAFDWLTEALRLCDKWNF